jgi:hypothetical protein
VPLAVVSRCSNRGREFCRLFNHRVGKREKVIEEF